MVALVLKLVPGVSVLDPLPYAVGLPLLFQYYVVRDRDPDLRDSVLLQSDMALHRTRGLVLLVVNRLREHP